MQLSFQHSHLSITSFPTTVVPDFTVISGPNGAGKSHLLQAILNGSISTDVTQINNQNEIRLFDWQNLVPQDTGAFTSDALRNERLNIETNLRNWQQHQNVVEPIRQIARNINFGQHYINDPFDLYNLTETEFDKLGLEQSFIEVRQLIEAAFENADNWILSQNGDNERSELLAISKYSKKPITLLKTRDIMIGTRPSWGRTNLFQQSFSRLFIAYRDAYLSNTIAQFQHHKGLEHDAYLSDDDFLSQNGPPPWDFVNQTISEAGLDFRINAPAQSDFSPYNPQLTKISSGVPISFSSLSSGEKILMSFAFCVYYANDDRQLSNYPKILLFDEIDAPLHPSMTRNLIDTITKTLVAGFGIKVIATTHSPSTIAMAPDESIHLMKPGSPGLHKRTKSQVLNVLTVGVPTISISFEGRRQVFVESPSDAKIFDSIYKILKASIQSERSLEFIATGTRSLSGQEMNTGCEVVKRLVSDMDKAGNQSIYGLIDFDGHHKATDRLAIVGLGERNGIENFIFDPLIIAALICRDCPDHKESIGLSNYNWLDFIKLSEVDLQRIVKNIGETIFEDSAVSLVKVSYCNNLCLDIDERWLKTDDHKLESLIVDRIPFLKSISKNQSDKLANHIISTVLTDNLGFIPAALRETLQDILDRPSHGQD